MACPISVVDIFFPGFSTLNASAQQLLLNNANGYDRLLCMGPIFVIFACYVYGYARDLINKYFSSFTLIKGEEVKLPLTVNRSDYSRLLL